MPAPPVGIVVFQMFYMYYIKNFNDFYIWNLDWYLCYTCFVTEKKSICKEILCCCSHEILGPVSIWIVILPFIFFPLLSCISHSVLMFSPWHLLLEKYNSHGFLIPLFLFPTEKNIRLSCFQSLETEKPDGHLSRKSIWWLPAYLLAVDSDFSVLYWILSGAETRTELWHQNEVPDEMLKKTIITGICPICPISSSENKNSAKVDHLLSPAASMHFAFVLLLVLLLRFISWLLISLCFCSFVVLFGPI